MFTTLAFPALYIANSLFSLMNKPPIWHLSDRAIVLYFALKELQPITPADLCVRLNKSNASLYRAMSELRAAGYLPSLVRTPPALVLTSDFSNAQ